MAKTRLEIIEDFAQHYCVICKQQIAVMCGTPIVYWGGCCTGVSDEQEKVDYIRPLKAHIQCFFENPKPKLKFKFNEIKKYVK